VPAETLTEARIRALRSRMSARDVRDAKLKGFGVRVLPSGGGRYFIHCQHNGRRIWKIVGDADDLSVSEACSRATPMLAAIRQDTPVPTQPEETVFEAVSEAAFRRHERIWKPRTIEVNRGYLRKQVLPRFSGCQIAEITRQDVVHWFASLRATPVARTGPCRSFRSSCARRSEWVSGRRGPTPASASAATEGRAGSASSAMRKSDPWQFASRPMKATSRWPSLPEVGNPHPALVGLSRGRAVPS